MCSCTSGAHLDCFVCLQVKCLKARADEVTHECTHVPITPHKHKLTHASGVGADQVPRLCIRQIRRATRDDTRNTRNTRNLTTSNTACHVLMASGHARERGRQILRSVPGTNISIILTIIVINTAHYRHHNCDKYRSLSSP